MIAVLKYLFWNELTFLITYENNNVSSCGFKNIFMITLIITRKALKKWIKIRSFKYDQVNISNRCILFFKNMKFAFSLKKCILSKKCIKKLSSSNRTTRAL